MGSDPISFDDPRFAAAVERVLHSYAAHGGINHIDGVNLPSREHVVEILQDLQEVVFPGYYEKEPLERLNVRYVIGQRLARAFNGLCEEIFKAHQHRDRCGKSDEDWNEDLDRERARDNAMNLIEAIPEIRAVLREDALAALDGDPAAGSFVDVVMSYPSVRAVSAYRIAHHLHELEVPLIPRMITEHLHSKTGIDIHPGAQIGTGVFIDHGTGVVIGETSVIGNHVKIYQGVTLGALSVEKDPEGKWRTLKRHPTIEDHVTIYAGATILGGETVIGEGSVIGGNVWLTRSVPAHTKVMIDAPYLVFEDTSNGKVRRELTP